MIIKSNHKLYSNLTSKLLTTSSSFYDQTPIGRIVSRYTNDLSTLDSNCSNVLI
jgi:ABC-type multidrug transport system fused ATPase/permease subunit